MDLIQGNPAEGRPARELASGSWRSARPRSRTWSMSRQRFDGTWAHNSLEPRTENGKMMSQAVAFAQDGNGEGGILDIRSNPARTGLQIPAECQFSRRLDSDN